MRPDIRAISTKALKKLAPALGVSILVGVGVVLGSLLLFFGVVLAVAWSVSLPVTVAETSNDWRALSRSRALTRGYRGRIFLLFLAAGIAFVVIFTPALGMLAMAGVRTGAAHSVIITLLSSAVSLVTSVGAAVLYVQLRDLKGGGGERLAQVFA